jgi:hypothetical protein
MLNSARKAEYGDRRLGHVDRLLFEDKGWMGLLPGKGYNVHPRGISTSAWACIMGRASAHIAVRVQAEDVGRIADLLMRSARVGSHPKVEPQAPVPLPAPARPSGRRRRGRFYDPSECVLVVPWTCKDRRAMLVRPASGRVSLVRVVRMARVFPAGGRRVNAGSVDMMSRPIRWPRLNT